VARSTDDGATFQREERANAKPAGACGCCGMKAYADSKGTVYILYRAADGISRDMTLLVSRNHAVSFELATVNKWMINACPMSSCSFAERGSGVVAATEREGQVGFNSIEPETLKISGPASFPGGEKRRHPAVASNSEGDVVLTWTEGTAWEKGGALAWQLFDKNGKATAEKGRVDGVPVWSLPTVFAGVDGRFEIIY
jgi:hypothetical protein